MFSRRGQPSIKFSVQSIHFSAPVRIAGREAVWQISENGERLLKVFKPDVIVECGGRKKGTAMRSLFFLNS
jgi:hypothetical protein